MCLSLSTHNLTNELVKKVIHKNKTFWITGRSNLLEPCKRCKACLQIKWSSLHYVFILQGGIPPLRDGGDVYTDDGETWPRPPDLYRYVTHTHTHTCVYLTASHQLRLSRSFKDINLTRLISVQFYGS